MQLFAFTDYFFPDAVSSSFNLHTTAVLSRPLGITLYLLHRECNDLITQLFGGTGLFHKSRKINVNITQGVGGLLYHVISVLLTGKM